jgi:hypothetical protein
MAHLQVISINIFVARQTNTSRREGGATSFLFRTELAEQEGAIIRARTKARVRAVVGAGATFMGQIHQGVIAILIRK